MTNNAQSTFRENRYFVLDTNVLLHDSNSLFAFKDVVVVVPFVVLEELDKFKREPGEMGRTAREVIRTLDGLRKSGPLNMGVLLNHGTGSAILKVMPTPVTNITDCVCADTVDNQIILIVQWLTKQGNTVTFVTKDINARVKADSLGLDAEDYTKGKIDRETYYKGWTRVAVNSKVLREISGTRLPSLIDIDTLQINEFIIVESENNPENNKLFRYLGGKAFREVRMHPFSWNFTARNIQQLMALDLLMDDDIKMISLLGPAGTGKTFLTLLVGLEKVAREKMYRKFLISRPIVALGADIGFLPGDLQEKLHNWMMPVHDNLEFIFSKQKNEGPLESQAQRTPRERRHERIARSHLSDVQRLQNQGIISIEAITYMRGRSIPYQFIFIDEVQNLTPHEVKTIVSRVGEGSKIVLAGDPYQIDSPYLDFTTNGLTVTTEKFKNLPIFGTVFLDKSERSELAKLAAEIL